MRWAKDVQRTSIEDRRRAALPRVVYVQYTNPGAYPPLESSSHILAEAGFDVRMLGTRLPGLEALTVRRHPRVRVRLMGTKPTGVRHAIHYVAYCVWAVAYVLWTRPRWVYASDVLGAPVGLVATFLPGPKVLYHEHDRPTTASSGFVRACLTARARLLRRADAVVVPDRNRASGFPAGLMASDRLFEVWNCPRSADVSEPTDRPPQPFRVLYHGTLVPERLPLAIVDALARIDHDWRLVLVGYETVVNPGYVSRLRLRAAELGCETRIEFRGPLPRWELFPVAAGCHLGLSLVPSQPDEVNLSSMTRASCKVFDYLASGTAVLVPDQPDWRQRYADEGLAVTCDPDSVEALTAVFAWCAARPDALAEMGARGQALVRSTWNYETRFAPVLETMRAPDRDVTGAEASPSRGR